MLIRAAKPNFDSLQEAAKQLFICAFSKKQSFHSTCQNDYYPRTRTSGRPFPSRRWEMPVDGPLARQRTFKLEELKQCEKNFYTPHPNVLNRSESEVKSFYEEHDIHIFGNSSKNCPAPIFGLDELDLPAETQEIIRKLNYTRPTPIQSQTWPIALSGLNMVGVAQTGSGKTLGFVLPGLIHIKHQPPLEKGDGPIALVVAPTRELAQQTDRVFVPFAGSYLFRTACVFGGASKVSQGYRLRDAHICVGTPGRIIDFLQSDTLNLNRCTYCVLDEADRLLDMGFEPQIRAIMNQMRPDSQVLMWSATWPKEVQHLASDFLKNYIGVKFGSSELAASPNVTQQIHVCDKSEKRSLLLNLLESIGKEKTLIFSQTKHMADWLFYFLRDNGFRAEILHGDKSQVKRDRAIGAFRSGRSQILIGTNVVGRGLDITDIKHVIIYDFPTDIEDYIHIIGRTGRCNNKGTAYTFFTAEDARFARDLIKILKQTDQEVSPELTNFLNVRGEYDSRGRRTRYYR